MAAWLARAKRGTRDCLRAAVVLEAAVRDRPRAVAAIATCAAELVATVLVGWVAPQAGSGALRLLAFGAGPLLLLPLLVLAGVGWRLATTAPGRLPGRGGGAAGLEMGVVGGSARLGELALYAR